MVKQLVSGIPNVYVYSIIFALIVTGLALSGFISLPQAGVPISSDTVTFTNGKVVHQQTFTLDGGQVTTNAMYKPDSYTFSNGSTSVPKKNVSITFTQGQQICTYRLDSHNEPVIFGQNLNIWKYYTIGNPQLTSFIRVQTSESDGYVDLDATKLDSAILNAKDGKGTLEASTKGLLRTSSQCPDTSGLIVLNNAGQPRVVSEAAYNQYKQNTISDATLVCGTQCLSNVFAINCLNCVSTAFNNVQTGIGVPIASNFIGEFDGLTFADPSSAQTKTQLAGAAKSGSTRFGNPVVQIVADADYFDSFIVEPQKIIKPSISYLSCGNFNMGTSATHKVVMENVGNDLGTFKYTITTTKGTLTPSSDTIQIESGDSSEVNLVHSLPSVSSNTPYTLNVKVCSYGLLEESCVQKSCTGVVNYVEEGIIPPEPEEGCGNNVCEPNIGETTLTCSKDCKVLDCSGIANSEPVDGVCVCSEGYKTLYDTNTGKKFCGTGTCVESVDAIKCNTLDFACESNKMFKKSECILGQIAQIVMLIVGGIVAIATIWFITRKPKGGKRK